MPITTNALNFLINNAQAEFLVEDFHLALTYSTPTATFSGGSIPSNILTDLPSASFGSASGGVRLLENDVVLEANQNEYASYLAYYQSDNSSPNPVYTLVCYVDITPIELIHSPATLVTVSKDTTYISLANT